MNTLHESLDEEIDVEPEEDSEVSRWCNILLLLIPVGVVFYCMKNS